MPGQAEVNGRAARKGGHLHAVWDLLIFVETQTNSIKVRQNLPPVHAMESLWITARRLHQFKTRMERTKSHPRWVHWWLTWFLMLEKRILHPTREMWFLRVFYRRLVRCCWHWRIWIVSQDCIIYLNSWTTWITFSGNSEHCSGL